MMTEHTALFGVVEISQVFEDEEQARDEGYWYDAHAYGVNQFGGMEPVDYKVMVRWKDFVTAEFARVGGNENERRADGAAAGAGE